VGLEERDVTDLVSYLKGENWASYVTFGEVKVRSKSGPKATGIGLKVDRILLAKAIELGKVDNWGARRITNWYNNNAKIKVSYETLRKVIKEGNESSYKSISAGDAIDTINT
jgi:hypothetical protein